MADAPVLGAGGATREGSNPSSRTKPPIKQISNERKIRMLTSYVEESATKKTLEFEVPADDVRHATDKVAKELARKIRLPGFRPGKVPLELVKKRFADELKNEVVEALLNDVVRDAIKEKNLFPLGQPRVADLKFEADAPMTFKVSLDVRPTIALATYKGLKVPHQTTDAAPGEVEAVINRIREQHAAYEPIEDRPATDGDFALVDIHGSYPQGDGKDFSAEKTLIEVGGAQTMPELSSHLRNAPVGISFTFQKTFPEDLQDPEFAGKVVLYSVTFVALKKRTLPEVDDEFARTALTPTEGEPPADASVDLLKQRVAESVKRDKERALKEAKRRAVLDQLLATHTVEAPEPMITSEVDSSLREYARYLSRQGVDLKSQQIDWNDMRKQAEPAATRRVQEYLLLDAVGDAEKVTITDTELDAELKRQAAAGGVSFSELKASLVKNDRLESMREEMRIEKVLQLLLDVAATA